jgi:predicted protein tyrosine phosphatase
MSIHSLEFLSVDEAQAFVPNIQTVAISILTPGRAPAQLDRTIQDVLRLYFHDSVPYGREPRKVDLFSPEQAQAVIDFLRRHNAQSEPRHLLIHCEAGISRSAAVAVFAASECRVPLSGQFAFLNPWVLATLVKTSYPQYVFD